MLEDFTKAPKQTMKVNGPIGSIRQEFAPVSIKTPNQTINTVRYIGLKITQNLYNLQATLEIKNDHGLIVNCDIGVSIQLQIGYGMEEARNEQDGHRVIPMGLDITSYTAFFIHFVANNLNVSVNSTFHSANGRSSYGNHAPLTRNTTMLSGAYKPSFTQFIPARAEGNTIPADFSNVHYIYSTFDGNHQPGGGGNAYIIRRILFCQNVDKNNFSDC